MTETSLKFTLEMLWGSCFEGFFFGVISQKKL